MAHWQARVAGQVRQYARVVTEGDLSSDCVAVPVGNWPLTGIVWYVRHVNGEEARNRGSGVNTLVDDHTASISSLDDHGTRLADVIERLLQNHGVHLHSVVHRVKTQLSFQRKLEASPGKYRRLADVTDRLGIRVITYFPDDVDVAAGVIESNFAIDRPNSVDRRATLEPDRFGYLSLHYVATLSEARGSLPEYASQRQTKFEIQVRSILQHTWAEIEHDLGYKSPSAIPAPVRRRFSRLAGLLEIADDEFAAIRDELSRYATDVTEALHHGEAEVGVDRESLVALIGSSVVLGDVDEAIRKTLGASALRPPNSAYAAARAEELARVGYTSLTQLEVALSERAELIQRFALAWAGKGGPSSSGNPARGVGLFYLFLSALAEAAEAGTFQETDVRGGFQSQRWGDLIEFEPLRTALLASLAEAKSTD